ncbi:MULTISPECIES: tRNA lysidine(34) synthetase TilS [Pelosinus]|uniref:tRNA(Ile)-lysidine synthase n=1 Tax=Pelosinus fermentans B4 TaxID=1149862 RepID=I8RLU2_9FIRM|nr:MULTISPECIES: tRNA lysidine(34) synthetase TilS [Pelosinus]EIW19645.1 tRNA(Ile)-lysidine synthetase [Pelosinus fermentans B4]EIW24612.1 tRNA(Ile)-lysidine synthase [Pelosinus fermentans A11]OAM95923.1 tRNA(Ile)-lysidine synthase [Pelosinus fermentans DSM 17108]SDR34400.1 tRNA(Ile)-lysidine synthase [Pelosinus fermentans]
MLEKVKAWIDRNGLLEQEDTIVVACSGGPDSLALLHILAAFRSEYNMHMVVAHVDHMLRGDESAMEAAFVVDFCAKRSLICYHKAIDVPAFMKETGKSGEEAARIVRYQYLRQVAKEVGGAKIATGHHRDDQAETVLMNMLRGSGSAGIRGMQPMNGDIIRPLLSVSRADIIAYCKMEQLEPKFDSSNFETNYLRNRIRIHLLPELEKQYNSAVKDSLCRTATIVGDEHDFIRHTAKSIWLEVVKEKNHCLLLVAKQLKLIHIAVTREIIRLAIEKKQGSLTGISFYHVETLIEMLFHGRVGSILQLPGGLTIHKTYDGLYVGKKPFALTNQAAYAGQELTIPGITQIQQLGIQISAELTAVQIKSQLNVAVFDADELSLPLFVRTRRVGDRFMPLGFAGNKKVKDFFIDEKIPRELRDLVPIICDEGGILWIGGYRQSRRGEVTDKTKTFLQLRILENAIKNN